MLTMIICTPYGLTKEDWSMENWSVHLSPNRIELTIPSECNIITKH